jgi:hypothetical protein
MPVRLSLQPISVCYCPSAVKETSRTAKSNFWSTALPKQLQNTTHILKQDLRSKESLQRKIKPSFNGNYCIIASTKGVGW